MAGAARLRRPAGPVLRIELTVYTDNAAAIALYRKFGFEIEGTHRAYALRDGRLCRRACDGAAASEPAAHRA